MPSHRLLYAGDDTGLPARIRDGLGGLDCFVVSAPANIARTFLQSDIKYSLLLFDETAEGVELERFTRSLTHREHTPVIVVKKSEDPGRLFDTIKRRLSATRAP
jgi:hypothetical protein